jgi:uncharacterized membrane protein
VNARVLAPARSIVITLLLTLQLALLVLSLPGLALVAAEGWPEGWVDSGIQIPERVDTALTRAIAFAFEVGG